MYDTLTGNMPTNFAAIMVRTGTAAPIVICAVVALAVIFTAFYLRMCGLLSPGNKDEYNADRQGSNERRTLEGRSFIFLGSSITLGFAAKKTSFADMIAYRNGCNCVKEAVSGTTLVDKNQKSYVSRLKTISPDTKCDVFVCQLSTNDASFKSPLGTLSENTDIGSFDTHTIYGAMEYIIAYVKDTWNCPVLFYSNPRYPSEQYEAMVGALDRVAAKWDVHVLDLWNNKQLEIPAQYAMNDKIHPTKKGYAIWTPFFEEKLEEILDGGAQE